MAPVYTNSRIASTRKWSVLSVNPCEVGSVQSLVSVVAVPIHAMMASIDGFMDVLESIYFLLFSNGF
jgi:hypothetical protein